MIDLSLLRIMKHRADYYKIRSRVPESAIDAQTRAILQDFDTYFTRMPEAQSVDMEIFLPVFRAAHPNLNKDRVGAYEAILEKLKVDVSSEHRSGIMQSLLTLRLGTDIGSLLARWDQGEAPNIHHELRQISDTYERDSDTKALDYLRMDVNSLLDDSHDDGGISWRLDCLNKSMRALRGGDFGIIAGRPDKGKTTFLASEVTCLAPQLPADLNVVWLNNEGKGERIYMRLLQAALNAQMSDIREMRDAGKDVAGMYAEIVGNLHRIRIVDVHGLDTYAVENILKENNAGIVVYDMIDKIRGFGDAARTDLGLECMYDWARELGVKYDRIGLATSQISNEGDGLQFPSLGMLKDSKTGKQGACDFQLMIGASNDQNLAGLRYLGLPKNKLRREGSLGDPRATVNFKPQVARFCDVPVLMGGESD
jgi:replicative DNA helicase